MKKLALSLVLVASVAFVSCKETAKEPTTETEGTEVIAPEAEVTPEAEVAPTTEGTEVVAPETEVAPVTEEAAPAN
ncbi:MAG TPA: hypothetical protein VLY87_06870 [Flavobacterium sp.]|nr:hypothetical protein [Flavobacterium sp.]